MFKDMMMCGDRKSQFGMSAGRLLQSAPSHESLPNPAEKPSKKANPFALTKKLNGKIQSMSAKLTDIKVFSKEVNDSSMLPLGPSFMFLIDYIVQGGYDQSQILFSLCPTFVQVPTPILANQYPDPKHNS